MHYLLKTLPFDSISNSTTSLGNYIYILVYRVAKGSLCDSSREGGRTEEALS
jgi:hypothetical protein